jgi:hypothetical protein
MTLPHRVIQDDPVDSVAVLGIVVEQLPAAVIGDASETTQIARDCAAPESLRRFYQRGGDQEKHPYGLVLHGVGRSPATMARERSWRPSTGRWHPAVADIA